MAKTPQNNEDLLNIKEKLFSIFLEISKEWTNDDYKELLIKINNLSLNGKKYNLKDFILGIYLITAHKESKNLLHENIELHKQTEDIINNYYNYEEYKNKYMEAINDKYFTADFRILFPRIYKELEVLFDEDKDIVFYNSDNYKIDLSISLKEFAELLDDNCYNSQFRMFLPNFTIKNKEIDIDSFNTAISNAKKRNKT